MKIVQYSIVILLLLAIYIGIHEYYDRYRHRSYVRSVTATIRSFDNLEQIAIAIKSYQDTHKTEFPFLQIDKDGNNTVNWRVSLLPFLGENELHASLPSDLPSKHTVIPTPSIFVSPKRKHVRGIDSHTGLTSHFLIRLSKKEIIKMYSSSDPLQGYDDINDPEEKFIVVVDASGLFEAWDRPQMNIDDSIIKNRIMSSSETSLFFDLKGNRWKVLGDD